MQYFDFRLCIKHKQNHVLAKKETISICESKTSKDSLTNFSWCNDFPCTYLQCRHYPFQLDPSHKVLIALWQALHQKNHWCLFRCCQHRLYKNVQLVFLFLQDQCKTSLVLCQKLSFTRMFCDQAESAAEASGVRRLVQKHTWA